MNASMHGLEFQSPATPAERRLEAKIRRLVHRIDPSVQLLFPHKVARGFRPRKYTWDGHSLCPNVETYESYLHDVAHYLLATPKMRQYPEFGLGADPYRASDAHVIVPSYRHEQIEANTCLMQVLLVVGLDLNPAVVTQEVGTPLPDRDDLLKFKEHFRACLSQPMWTRIERILEWTWYENKRDAATRDMEFVQNQIAWLQAEHATKLAQLDARLQLAKDQLDTLAQTTPPPFPGKVPAFLKAPS